MGLFSKIKKAVKSVVKSVKKVFKKIIKPFAKILNNKWVKGILLATSVFTMGASLAGTMGNAFAKSGFGAMIKAGVGEVIKASVKMLVSPIDLIAKGISGIGSMTGMTSLTKFGQGVSSGLAGVTNSVDNIFTTVSKPVESAATGEQAVTSIVDENPSLKGGAPDADKIVSEASKGGIDITGKQGVDTVTGGTGVDSIVPSDMHTGTSEGLTTVTNKDVIPDSLAPSIDVSGAQMGTKTDGVFKKLWDTTGDILGGASDFLEKHSALVTIGGTILEGAMTPDPRDQYEDYMDSRDKRGFNDPVYAPPVDMRGLGIEQAAERRGMLTQAARNTQARRGNLVPQASTLRQSVSSQPMTNYGYQTPQAGGA